MTRLEACLSSSCMTLMSALFARRRVEYPYEQTTDEQWAKLINGPDRRPLKQIADTTRLSSRDVVVRRGNLSRPWRGAILGKIVRTIGRPVSETLALPARLTLGTG